MKKKPLLDVIEEYLDATGMGETYFGKMAARNSELVRRLRNNGRVFPETDEKVREYIRANKGKKR